MEQRKIAIVIGAGPAGLTAAYELLQRTGIKPIVIESEYAVGGISKTVDYKGNRFDIGGHRFFSKSDKVVAWWLDKLPLQGFPSSDDKALNREVPLSTLPGAPDPETTDKVMLTRNRVSRIYAFGKLFDYPISAHLHSLLGLGPVLLVRIFFSYVAARLRPIRPEKNLEDFFINRFGRLLYATFFKSYTQKVWGISCKRIDPSWGAQRVKGVSISSIILHALRKTGLLGKRPDDDKEAETSLIDRFMYPKLGPGQLWEKVAESIRGGGGEIRLGCEAVGFLSHGGMVDGLTVRDRRGGGTEDIAADYVISSMPIRDLVSAFGDKAPAEVREAAGGLVYRGFVVACLILRRLTVKNGKGALGTHGIIPDNWIYVQERKIRIGRIQVFNNWSPYLARDNTLPLVGVEYFCNEGDSFWSKTDARITKIAGLELVRMGFIDSEEDILDSTVARVPKAYPAYYGAYNKLPLIRAFADSFKNLFLIGRNGLHRYNNLDHSMLTAMAAVDNISGGITSKDNIWQVNAEEVYQEGK